MAKTIDAKKIIEALPSLELKDLLDIKKKTEDLVIKIQNDAADKLDLINASNGIKHVSN